MEQNNIETNIPGAGRGDSPMPGNLYGWLSVSPIAVFLLLYLAVSIIIGDFYRMPVSVALLGASIWGVGIFVKGGRAAQRLEVFSRAAADTNILYMIWIFVLAGAFASVAKETGAVTATVNATLRLFPAELLIPGLFVAACFISLSIGTSVGTIVALAPLAVDIAEVSGGEVALYTAVVLGGAFFGDNLSFISDTTIAATRTQGCSMSDKFKANLWIAVPAAVITLGILLFISHGTGSPAVAEGSDSWLMIPYLLVIVLSVAGVNVPTVLTSGILASIILGRIAGYDLLDMCGFVGKGIDSMGDLIIITLLAAGMLGIVKAMGGIGFLLGKLTSHVRSSRGGQWAIAMLVGVVNLCTANNTVAIITVGSIAKDISSTYGIDPRKSASLLDTCSCIVQCLIPYGAQTLLATSLAGLSPIAPFPYLYYPWALALMVALSITFQFPRRLHRAGHQTPGKGL